MDLHYYCYRLVQIRSLLNKILFFDVEKVAFVTVCILSFDVDCCISSDLVYEYWGYLLTTVFLFINIYIYFSHRDSVLCGTYFCCWDLVVNSNIKYTFIKKRVIIITRII